MVFIDIQKEFSIVFSQSLKLPDTVSRLIFCHVFKRSNFCLLDVFSPAKQPPLERFLHI